MSVKGLGASIHQQSSLGHGVHQPPDVVADIRSAVTVREHADDVVDGPLAVTEAQHLRGVRIEPDGALGDEQQVLLAHLVVAQTCTGDKARAGHASGPGGWESPRSMASNCAHSIS